MQRNTTDSSTRHSSSPRTICIATVPFVGDNCSRL